MSPLEIWYDRIDLAKAIEDAPDKAARKRRERLQEQARKRVAENLFPKLVTTDGGRMRIVDQPPLIFHPPDVTPRDRALEFLDAYRASLADDRRVLFDRYRFEDAAVKIVGVGSVGTRCFVVLFTSEDGHPLLLQVKEANNSVLAPYLGRSREKVHNGKRVVVGQHLMQPASDIFLGWATGPTGRDFYVRQLRDMKVSVTLAADVACSSRTTPSSAAWRSPAPTPTPAPPPPSPATSAPAARPTRRSRSSAWPTPTRPNATTAPSSRRSTAAESPPSWRRSSRGPAGSRGARCWMALSIPTSAGAASRRRSPGATARP